MVDSRPVSSTPACRVSRTVLIVDDDPTMREESGRLLRVLGLTTYEASTCAEVLHIARSHHVDLALIDQRLDKTTGLSIAQDLLDAGLIVPWVIYSGFMDHQLACDAGRLGALRAVSMPFDVEEVVLDALTQSQQREGSWPKPFVALDMPQPSAANMRAAWWILRGSDSPDDLPTLGEWCQFVRVSYTQFAEAYRRLGIQPSNARDFMRVFRALLRNDGRLDLLVGELALSDYRTTNALVERAGLVKGESSNKLSFEDFVQRQHFISPDHSVLQALRALIRQLT